MDTNFIEFNNGVYDLKNGEFIYGRSYDSVGYDLPEYENGLENEIFIELNDFFESIYPDKDLKEYVLTLFANVLEGRNTNTKFYIFTGICSTGKSTIMELLSLMLGKYTCRPSHNLFTKRRKFEFCSVPELMGLINKRLVVNDDSDELIINKDIMEPFLNYEPIHIKDLYPLDRIKSRPKFMVFFNAYNLSLLSSKDPYIWRKVVKIDHLNRFVNDPTGENERKIDTNLWAKMQKYAPALMYLLLNKYYPIFKEKGLVEPQCILDGIVEYKRLNNIYSDKDNKL